MNDHPGTQDDSDDECESWSRSTYESYQRRPEWQDIEPVSIKTKTSVMDIRYSPRFEDAFSYFRAVLIRDELSERSLQLTADCIDLQPSNFSVWYFRRRILRALSHHLEGELTFVGGIIELEPKNYQVWHHRKTIVEWLKDASDEKQLTASVLNLDTKNYHAWQHRQWAIKEFNMWPGELEFTEAQLALDVRNNSAWNHRYYVCKETKKYDDSAWLDNEIQFVMSKIESSPNNESSWSYLRGLLKLPHNGLSLNEKVEKFCEGLYQDKNCRSPQLIAFMIDVIWEKLSLMSNSYKNDRQSMLTKAVDLCDNLANNYDKIRSEYWHYIKKKLKDVPI